MALQLILVSALFIGLSNLCMRKSIDSGGTTKGFLMIQLCIITLFAIILNPVRTGAYSWSSSMGLFGVLGGTVLTLMFWSLGKSLEKGPPGLIFSILNASSVVPSLLMALICGSAYGFVYAASHGFGSAIVLLGLFWAGLEESRRQRGNLNWAFLALSAFGLHVLFLLFMQWRVLHLNPPDTPGLYLSFDMEDARSQWFMPMVYGSAAILQSAIFKRTEKRALNRGEWLYGIFGGISGGFGAFFMIKSTEMATGWQMAMLFPLWSVSIILVCNTWGKIFYSEKVNWVAIGLCVAGIVIGTADWSVLQSR